MKRCFVDHIDVLDIDITIGVTPGVAPMSLVDWFEMLVLNLLT